MKPMLFSRLFFLAISLLPSPCFPLKSEPPKDKEISTAKAAIATLDQELVVIRRQLRALQSKEGSAAIVPPELILEYQQKSDQQARLMEQISRKERPLVARRDSSPMPPSNLSPKHLAAHNARFQLFRELSEITAAVRDGTRPESALAAWHEQNAARLAAADRLLLEADQEARAEAAARPRPIEHANSLDTLPPKLKSLRLAQRAAFEELRQLESQDMSKLSAAQLNAINASRERSFAVLGQLTREADQEAREIAAAAKKKLTSAMEQRTKEQVSKE